MSAIRALAAWFFLALTATRSGATLSTVIDLGPPGVFHDNRTVFFSDLNSLPLNGENLSLDFTFANSFGIRLLTHGGFSIVVDLLTNANGELNYSHSGYFVNKQGNRIGSQQSYTTRISGNPVPIYLLLEEPSESADLYGIHFDFTIPLVAGAEVTGGDLRLQTRRFGAYEIGALPETGSTLTLLGTALIAPLVGYSTWRVVALARANVTK
jgi:hypothetical protein